jgi:hypothetical protein
VWEGTVVNLSHASSSKDMRVRDCQCGNKLKKARRADEEMVVEGDHAKRSDRRSHAEGSPGWSAANHVEEAAWRKNCFCRGLN